MNTGESGNIHPANRNQIVVFSLDRTRCALFLSVVERVVRAVEITALPKAPEIVLGVIIAQGRIIPVVDIRRRFRFPAREPDCDDRFLIARTSGRVAALVVDNVEGIRELAEEKITSAEHALPFAEYVQGVAKLEGDLVLIYDLGRFLSIDEEKTLDAALSGGRE
jgi:purine-binding chemotaxis protein CheW